MAVFRVEKTKDFTIMCNHHLRNTELSLKAKGLLSLMLSLPEDWDYTTKGLAHICKDGVDSITTALKELERHGYARQREPGETLEDIYRRFHIDHPEDFRGHFLSVSDVVILHENGADAAYYVDSIGFKELPGFFDAGAPEARRDVSVREQLDNARKQAAQTEPKALDKRPREPERS